MAESVKIRTGKLPDGLSAQELRALMAAVVDALQTIATKLDGETTLKDKDYSASVSKLITD